MKAWERGFYDELVKLGMIRPGRIPVAGAKSYTKGGVAKLRKTEASKAVFKPVMTKQLSKKLSVWDRRMPIGSRSAWGVDKPELLGQMQFKPKRKK
jgi:hypothetical protein